MRRAVLPPVRERAPSRGRHHPAGAGDVRAALEWFGLSAHYGVKLIELVPVRAGDAGLVLGRLVGPGHIVLYDQRASPWRLGQTLRAADLARLAAAGADVAVKGVIVWPDDTLRRFVLGHVLAHELGHHVVQHEARLRGKRAGAHGRARGSRGRDRGRATRSTGVRLRLLCDGVENPANRATIATAARLLGGSCVEVREGRLIAVDNTPGARSIYGRRGLRETATLAVGHERRGVSRTILAAAAETLVIPTQSRSVRTLNVAAAAAVAGWYVLRGSREQARSRDPYKRMPAVLRCGEDHVEVGSSLRSAAAFGIREIWLEDLGASWFEGEHGRLREARAAARRHKNPLRVRRGSPAIAERFEEVVVIVARGEGAPLSREHRAHGARQLVVIGADPDRVDAVAPNVRVATLGLAPGTPAPLRILASIACAEISRQAGSTVKLPPQPPPRTPVYEHELAPADIEDGDMLLAPEALRDY